MPRRRRLVARVYPIEQLVSVGKHHEARRAAERIGTFALVVVGGVPKTLVFRCPCGCGELLSLNLLVGTLPAWRARTDASGRLSVWPSVERETGCRSHFWILHGKVHLYRPGRPPNGAKRTRGAYPPEVT